MECGSSTLSKAGRKCIKRDPEIVDRLKGSDNWQKFLSRSVLLLCLCFLLVLFKAYLEGKFNSVDTLKVYVTGFGLLAPVILTLIQAVQVVIPVLPGFLGCAVGAMLFGSSGGFWCNYIGISLGSIIAFLLARRYGVEMVRKLFREKTFEKWSAWLGNSRYYTGSLFMAMLLPLFPDDFLCYFTGLTKMSIKRFVVIILLGKPWCILAYSLLFAQI